VYSCNPIALMVLLIQTVYVYVSIESVMLQLREYPLKQTRKLQMYRHSLILEIQMYYFL